jgi:hypothetical protein
MSESAGTNERLEEARRQGADRIYGYPIRRQLPAAATYLLKATDRDGHTLFRRELSWPSYCEAVRYWMTLGTPNQAMSAEDTA